MTDTFFGEKFDHLFLGVLNGEIIQKVGVYKYSRSAVGERGFLHILAALYNLDYRQIELLRELPVALVVRGDGHNRAGAVAHQNVVGDKDRYFLAVYGVYRCDAFKFNARFVLVHFGAVKVGFARGFRLIRANRVHIREFVRPLFDKRVLGGNYHISRAEQRVAARGVDKQLVAERRFERHLRARRTSYPVRLSGFYLLEIINAVEVVKQLLRIVCDLQHPLIFYFMNDLAMAALAGAIHYLLIRENDLAVRAPVDVHFFFIRKSGFEQLEENPLCPFEVVGVGGVYLTFPVERQTQHFELISEPIDIALGDFCGVYLVFDSVVLGRQTESVPAHREQYIIALHTALSRDDIHCGIRTRVSNVQTLARRVRELYQSIIFGFCVVVFRVECVVFVPVILPFAFNGGEIVFHLFLSFHIKVLNIHINFTTNRADCQ